jgi:hypothetical protein
MAAQPAAPPAGTPPLPQEVPVAPRADVTKLFIIDFNFVVFDDRPELRPLSTAHDYAEIDAHEVYEYARGLGNNGIFCHAYTINGCAMYPSRLGPVSAGRAGTLLPDLFALARRDGLATWSYFDVGQDAVINATRQHWLIPGTAGGGHPPGFLAPETPWTDLLCARVEELLAVEPVDWLLFDGFVYGSFWPDLFRVPPASYMEGPFKEIVGRPLPTTIEEIRPEENHLYKREILARQFRRIRDAVKRASPRTKICFNVPFWKAAEPIWVDHPMVTESDGLIAETTNDELVEYLLSIKRPEQRLFLTVVNYIDGFRFDAEKVRRWHERGCDFHGYAWGRPPDWRPAPRFTKALDAYRAFFTTL